MRKRSVRSLKRKLFTSVLLFLVIPIVLYIGYFLLEEKQYNFISMSIVVIACIPFFIRFEKRKTDAKEMMIIAVMAALAVVGRAAFIWLPAFKPVTAITAITGFKLGPEAGFLTGALSAICSNILFGQGPWTPFQMFTWGTIGFIAGLLGRKRWMMKKIPLILFGIFTGVLFSFMMDIWTTLSYENGFSWSRYLQASITALPYTCTYAISNIIFLLLLTKPIGDKIERIVTKYGLNYNQTAKKVL